MVLNTVKARHGLRRREGEAAYLFAEWLVAMGIFVLFITMLTIPSFSDWHDKQSLRQGAAEMYLATHRVQNIAILSNGRDRPEFEIFGGGEKVRYTAEFANRTHEIQLPPTTRFTGDRAVFKSTGVRANGYGDLRLWRAGDYDKGYRFIIARSTGRIRMEKDFR